MAREDPELFATYLQLVAADPVTAGRAVFDATARFHNPTHAPEWSDPGIDAAFEGVRSLVLRGLAAQAAGPGRAIPPGGGPARGGTPT